MIEKTKKEARKPRKKYTIKYVQDTGYLTVIVEEKFSSLKKAIERVQEQEALWIQELFDEELGVFNLKPRIVGELELRYCLRFE
jgi:hypothetical protein